MKRVDVLFEKCASVADELEAIIKTGDVEHVASLEEDVSAHPGHADRHHRLAYLYFLKGEYGASLASLDRAIEINREFRDALHLKARILMLTSRDLEAIAIYRRVVASHPADAEAHHQLAVLHLRLGERQRGIDCGLRAVECDPGFESAHVLLAEQYLYQRRWEDAIHHYAIAQRIRPYEEYSYLLGLLHLQLGKAADAERHLEAALELKPSHLNSCIRLAVTKIGQGDYDRAHALLSRAIGFHPKYPDLRYSLAKVCLLMGRRDEAFEWMESSLELNPRYAEVHRELGYLHSLRRQSGEAVQQLRRSLEINPNDEQAFLNLGFIHSHQGEYASAVEILLQAIRRFPESWRAPHSLGIVHLQNRAFPQARIAFLDAVRIHPELEGVHRSLRIAFQDESLLEEERRRLVDTYSDEPGEMHHQLGLIYLDFHREKVASHHFQQSLDAGARTVENSILLSIVYANMQNFDWAIRVLEGIDAKGMTDWVRRTLLGLFWANAGDHDVALRNYQQVMTQAPLFFYAMDSLLVCFREQDQLDEMLDDYQDYARFHERNHRLLRRIGQIHAQKGMLVEAQHHLDQAVILDPTDARAYYSTGILQLARLNFRSALEKFQRAAEHAPNWSLPHLGLAIVGPSCDRMAPSRAAMRRFVALEKEPTWRELAERTMAESAEPVLARTPAELLARSKNGTHADPNRSAPTDSNRRFDGLSPAAPFGSLST